ncbi:hypothetical protein Lal_00040796 [Lupinus albus]|nr:hypothetical protein Lal_00040796 [Lupinus albus]
MELRAALSKSIIKIKTCRREMKRVPEEIQGKCRKSCNELKREISNFKKSRFENGLWEKMSFKEVSEKENAKSRQERSKGEGNWW